MSAYWSLAESLSQLSPQSKSCVAGALSGTCSALLFQPLELAKTRLQQNILVVSNSSLPHTCYVSEWWRGTSASVLRVLPGAAIYFGCLHALQHSFMPQTKETRDPRSSMGALQALMLGATARSMAAMALIPMTVVKTRFESNLYAYSSIKEALIHIWRKEGRAGLTSGLSATLLRDAPYSGLVFMFYSQLKQHALNKEEIRGKKKTMEHFLCGLMAGLMASVVTHPLDVIKTQMQLRPAIFISMSVAIRHIYRQQGIRGFGAGITARMARRTLMSATSWTIYDEITHRLKLR